MHSRNHQNFRNNMLLPTSLNRFEQRNDPKESNAATLVVVLGMHRSGTSTITRAMEALGADFGSRLMPAVAGVNDKGFFEDLDVNAINIEAMAAAGMDWHAMAPIDLGSIDPQRLEQLQTKAIATLRDKCTAKTFVLKDPRIARLLPFWQPVFACLDARVVYVIAIRNPISVTQSLAKRNDFPEEKSYLLWLAHIVPALAMTHDDVRTLVDYDRLMDCPRQELAKISQQLGLPLNAQAVSEFEREFLDNELRHTRYTSRDMTLVRSAPRQVKALFAALEVVASTVDIRHTPELSISIESAQRYLEDVAPLLRYEWRVEQDAQRLNETIANNDRRLAEVSKDLDEGRQYIAAEHLRVEQLCGENLTRQETIHSLQDVLQSREETLRTQEETIHSLQDALQSRDETLRTREETIHSLQDALQSRDETFRTREETLRALTVNQRAELARCAVANEQILTSTSWRVTAPLRAVRRYLTWRKR
jgi:hypothetical protein